MSHMEARYDDDDHDVLTASGRAVAVDAVSMADHSTNLKDRNDLTFPIVCTPFTFTHQTKPI